VHTAQDLETLASHHDAVYVAGTPWAALKSEIMAGHPGWVVTPEFKEGVATVAEAVAEGRRAAAAIEKTLADRQTGFPPGPKAPLVLD
jgi:NADPH-dependent glutamate synthase beta subunit-like oxidoreductase